MPFGGHESFANLLCSLELSERFFHPALFHQGPAKVRPRHGQIILEILAAPRAPVARKPPLPAWYSANASFSRPCIPSAFPRLMCVLANSSRRSSRPPPAPAPPESRVAA